jgi:hypothetical protein
MTLVPEPTKGSENFCSKGTGYKSYKSYKCSQV